MPDGTETAVLLSVRPRWARLIPEGRKRFEIRRIFPDALLGACLWLYACAPVSAVTGSVRLRSLDTESCPLDAEILAGACLDAGAAAAYLSGLDRARVLGLDSPESLDSPVPRACLQSTGLGPGQNYRYVRSGTPGAALLAARAVSCSRRRAA